MKSGRVAITGSARGLGRAMVEGFNKLGWQVVSCSRSLGVDVSQWAQVEAWAQEVISAGVPDLVLNNAALINRSAPLWEIEPREFQSLLNVNLAGVFHCCKAFLPAMIAKGSGVVVNFSSGWGRSTSPEVAPYCCTKWGIEGLTQALAQELPKGLAAVAFNPGIIHTEMLESCFGASASSYPNAEEWAVRAVPFLAGLGPQHNGRSLSL